MRMIICDVCEVTINYSEGKGYLHKQIAEFVAEQTQEINDMCGDCTNTLHSAIKEVIEEWRSSKGTFRNENS